MAVPRDRSSPKPLDQAALERLALRYVERFATTRAKLTRYLNDKIRARGWAGSRDPDPSGIAARFAELGYIDDRAFAVAKAGSMTRRGLGATRVRGALRQAGVATEDAAVVEPTLEQERKAAALDYARRKRIGPFATSVPDRPTREKHIAAMLRGGHSFALAKAVAMLGPDEDIDQALAAFD